MVKSNHILKLNIVVMNCYYYRLTPTRPFLETVVADVLLVQEIMRPDFDRLCRRRGWPGVFAPQNDILRHHSHQQGIGILSR